MIDENVISLATPGAQGETFHFLNRDNLQVHGRLWSTGVLASRLVIVVHGLGGSSQQAQIEGAVSSFVSAGCNVLTYDATNSFGNSGGDLSRATLTKHANDLEDVINWCKKTQSFSGDVIVCGFSMGASAAFVVQSRNRELIRSIIAFAPIVSGKVWYHNFRLYKPGSYARLQILGSFVKFDEKTGREGEITREFVDDVMTYDFINGDIEVKVPTFLVGGSEDKTCPPEALHALMEKLHVAKKIKILEGLPHTAKNPQEVRIIRDFLTSLILKSKDEIWPEQANRKVGGGKRH